MRVFVVFYLSILLLTSVSCGGERSSSERQSQSAPGISTKEAVQKYEDSSAVFIDVRTSLERSAILIPYSKHISIHSSDFSERIAELPRDTTYILYCHSGPRSQQAANMMKSNGFTSVYNLHAGISGWSGPTE